MKNVMVSSVRDEIFEEIKRIFGCTVSGFTKIELGYLNLKWRIKTDAGEFFVKQYNKTRYPGESIHRLETALNHQTNLYNRGIPCPQLYSYKGKNVLRTSSGERFVVMGICEGNNIEAGTSNEQQMYSLGKVVGQMHKIMNSSNTSKLPLHWDLLSKENMIKSWEERWAEASRFECSNTLSSLEVQRQIIDKNDLTIFSECEKGWAHWDLFVDNILFDVGRVSAILDFDRMNIVYTDFDISRPILSCCIQNGQLHIDTVSAFVEGYREYKPLPIEKLVRSIKLTWWKEAEWVRAEKIQKSLPLKRFIEENVWVGDHWDELESLLAAIDK